MEALDPEVKKTADTGHLLREEKRKEKTADVENRSFHKKILSAHGTKRHIEDISPALSDNEADIQENPKRRRTMPVIHLTVDSSQLMPEIVFCAGCMKPSTLQQIGVTARPKTWAWRCESCTKRDLYDHYCSPPWASIVSREE